MRSAGHMPPPDWMRDAGAGEVIAALGQGGQPARFVGGCVRDAILGRAVRDIDIATPEVPARVMALLRDAGIRAIPTGLDHGTVTALAGDGRFEITTLRRDVETFGRRARVAFTDDWESDALRRDFTMNALFADPDGTLYDPVGGLADLRAGRVRFVGEPDRRIAEDALRLLRFFRFHAHYGRGAPDGEALAACGRAAARLHGLSGERLASETFKLLQADAAGAVVGAMRDCGVLRELLGAYPPGAVGRLRRLVAIEVEQGETETGETPPLRRLAALLAGPEHALSVAERFRLSNADRERLAAMLGAAPDLAPEMPGAVLRRALHRHGAALCRDRVLLAWAAVQGADGAGWGALLQRTRDWTPPAFPLRGADVLALGVPPGPRVGELLEAIETWWEAGDFQAGREAALCRLRDLAAADGGTAT